MTQSIDHAEAVRIADLGLMLRAVATERAFLDEHATDGWWLIVPGGDPSKYVLADDGRGLPILTNSARAALRAALGPEGETP